jgi:hypothetical protein
MANAIVSSFFIQSPSAVSVFGIIQSCKELLCNILSREAEEMEALFEAPKKAACLRPLNKTIDSNLFGWCGCRCGSRVSALLALFCALFAMVMFLGGSGVSARRWGGACRWSLVFGLTAARLSKAQGAAKYQSARDCK